MDKQNFSRHLQFDSKLFIATFQQWLFNYKYSPPLPKSKPCLLMSAIIPGSCLVFFNLHSRSKTCSMASVKKQYS